MTARCALCVYPKQIHSSVEKLVSSRRPRRSRLPGRPGSFHAAWFRYCRGVSTAPATVLSLSSSSSTSIHLLVHFPLGRIYRIYRSRYYPSIYRCSRFIAKRLLVCNCFCYYTLKRGSCPIYWRYCCVLSVLDKNMSPPPSSDPTPFSPIG